MLIQKRWITNGMALLVAALLVAALLLTQPALGQQKEPVQFDTITVTADKREENIQEVPSGITVFGETDLEDAGIEDIHDVIDRVPNMVIGHMRGLNYVNIRGIGHSMFTGKNPVVIYVDGIPTDQASFFDADLNNVERVEVLRGPQGTLYGKNAIGGIINVVSKKPGNSIEGKITTEFAENETYGVKGFLNGPIISDKLFYSVSGFYRETRGYMKNTDPDQDYFDNEESSRFKSRLRWLPSDNLEMNLHVGIEQIRDGGGAYIASDKVRYHENRDPDDKKELDRFNSALNILYETHVANLISVTTFSQVENDGVADWMQPNPASNKNIAISDLSSMTQEFRIQSSDEDNRMKWLGGIYYSFAKTEHKDHSLIYNTKDWLGYYLKNNWPSDNDEETMAVFGQVTLPVTPRLNFTAGLRYENTHIEMDYRHKMTNADTETDLESDPFKGGTLPVAFNIDDEWDAFLPKGVVSFTLSRDAMIYASVSKGYLAGGFNAYNDDRENAKFNEQTSINYEIGAKTSWFDNKLILNGALYYIDIEDMHVWTSPAPNIYLASNAAKAHSQGAELEVRFNPFPGFDLTAGIGLIDAEFDDYTDMMGNDCSGKVPTNTPDYTVNLATQYRHNSGIYVRAEFLGTGKTRFDDTNRTNRDSYETVNAKIGYEGSGWDLYIYGDNLFDTEYFENMYETVKQYAVGTPRVVGLTVSLRF